MAVVRLAFFNVWRRLGRSFLALLAMAIAAAVLTSGLSLSRGLPKQALSNYRELFGGEIVSFTPGFFGSTSGDVSAGVLVRRQVIDSGFSRLLKYYPALREGYYADSDWEYRPFSDEDIRAITSVPGVAGTDVRYHMPAAVLGQPSELKPMPGKYWPDADPVTLWHYDFDVVLNAYGAPRAEVGDLVTIQMPHYRLDSHGIPYIDSSLPPTEYQGRVVGKVSIPTRSISWVNEMGGIMTEQAYVHSPDVYLTEQTWWSLWEKHSGAMKYPHLFLGITVDNMAELNVIKQNLQVAHPEIAFSTIAEFVRHLDTYAILDRFYFAPPHLWRPEFQPSHPMAQQDFGKLTAALLFLNAGMLLASQMLTAVAGRRNEIGILKAIGARNRDVVGMILLEAVIIALIGATAGFGLVRAAGIHLSLTNSIPIRQIVDTSLRELGLVLGLTLLASLVFGVLPAWKVAKLTVMEVFRNE